MRHQINHSIAFISGAIGSTMRILSIVLVRGDLAILFHFHFIPPNKICLLMLFGVFITKLQMLRKPINVIFGSHFHHENDEMFIVHLRGLSTLKYMRINFSIKLWNENGMYISVFFFLLFILLLFAYSIVQFIVEYSCVFRALVEYFSFFSFL